MNEFDDMLIDKKSNAYLQLIGQGATVTATSDPKFANSSISPASTDWVKGFAPKTIYVRDEKAVGTSGGASVAGVNIRILNTVVLNLIPGASLATNQLTLPAGTYDVRARSPNYNGQRHKCYLYNITAAANALIGSAVYNLDTSGVSTDTVLSGRITITATTVFELRHQITVATATYGLGVETNVSTSGIEIYAEIWVEKRVVS